MAARKEPNAGSKPPPARPRVKTIPREEPEDDLDSGWFDEEAPTTFKGAADAKPAPKPDAKAKAKAKASSRPPPVWEKPADKGDKTEKKPDKTAERQRIANAAKLLPPPTRRQTIEVQVDWLEQVNIHETTGKTIPVEADWLEVVEEGEEEAPTIVRGRRTPVSPPPIPKPPPIPREAKKSEPPKKGARRSSAPPPRKR